MSGQLSLLPEEQESTKRETSIMFGRDRDALTMLITMHAVVNPRILDCTHNKGTMWQGTPYRPMGLDISRAERPQLVADCRALPFRDQSFDVLVFDPPHLPTAAASAHSSRIWERRYGLTDATGGGRDGDNVSAMFLPFLQEARRVLVPNGLVLAKIADLTHNHRYQWQHIDFVGAVQAAEMTACDLLIKVDPAAGNLASGRWKRVRHLRKQHCYWIVVRNGRRCEARKGAA